jgi:uncharacterized protein (DUF2252 family)
LRAGGTHLKPSIPRGDRFWSLAKDEQIAMAGMFEEEPVRRLVTSLVSRPDNVKIELLDAAYWMKGCSSQGQLRHAVLLNLSDGKRKRDEFCLLDIKEAGPAAAPRAKDAQMPRDNGECVVQGAKYLSPALSDRMIAGRMLGRSVAIRELMPQDLKLDIDRLSCEEH